MFLNNRCLASRKFDSFWHQKMLCLYGAGLNLPQHLFVENSLVGNMLVDDQNTFAVRRNDVGIVVLG
tara:strand:- start:559 stop:759 length:201 start_codon:yes stop_codon:yes gene_type:complete